MGGLEITEGMLLRECETLVPSFSLSLPDFLFHCLTRSCACFQRFRQWSFPVLDWKLKNCEPKLTVLSFDIGLSDFTIVTQR